LSPILTFEETSESGFLEDMSDEDEEHVISQNHISSFDLSSIDEIPIPIP
jgi:hypothetical protein